MNVTTAADFLRAGLKHMEDRAITYDKPEGERSMGATVRAFAEITGVQMTEEQGWLFMATLKAVRTQQGKFRQDNYEDGAAYFALAGESASHSRAPNPAPAIDPDFGKAFKEAMAGDWLNWRPSIPCPTSDVEVEFRDGSRVKSKPYNLRWTWSEDRGAAGDIIRYRIIK